MQSEVANLTKDAGFCEVDKSYGWELFKSHTKLLTDGNGKIRKMSNSNREKVKENDDEIVIRQKCLKIK